MDDLSLAEKKIYEIKIGEQDFPWLADIRLLAMCEIESRKGNGKKEERLISEFLEKQPLLFEPEHVVSFFFMDYQEKLKDRYRKARLTRKAK